MKILENRLLDNINFINLYCFYNYFIAIYFEIEGLEVACVLMSVAFSFLVKLHF